MNFRSFRSFCHRALMAVMAAALGAACIAVPPMNPTTEMEAEALGVPLMTLTGRRTSLEKFRGQVVLVDVFATWCVPCIAQGRLYGELRERYAARGFEAVGIGMDLEGAGVLLPYIEFYGVKYPVFMPGTAMARGKSVFGQIQVLPYTLLLDRKGRIVWQEVGVVPRERVEAVILAYL